MGEKEKPERGEEKSSRRDAIKRLGLFGIGAALVPAVGAAAGARPLQSCYYSCQDDYTSIDSYGSYNTWSIGTYNSVDRYSSGGCYYSCEHTSYGSYSSQSEE
jgi:hypothetical protein